MSTISIESKKLLGRVVKFYRRSLSDDSAALAYMRDHFLIHKNRVIEDLGIGYSNGTLIEALPDDPNIIKQLSSLGILDDKGKEKLAHCLVVPLVDAAGATINLHARNLNNHHAWFTNRANGGILNCRAFKAFDHIMLAPTVMDLMVLYDRGYQNSAYICSNSNLDVLDPLSRIHKLKEIIQIRYRSANKKPSMNRLQSYFNKRRLASRILTIPGRSSCDYFKRHSSEDFDDLLKLAHSRQKRSRYVKRPHNATTYKETPDGFIYINGSRKYEIKGIHKKSTQFKVTIKASLGTGANAPFEFSTVDMYSYRARVWFAKMCSDLFAEGEDLIQVDLHYILEYAETFNSSETKAGISIAEEDKEAAMRFLNNPVMMDEILADFESIGVVGERTNKLVGYLAAVSRKLSDPLSVMIQSRSATGKSTLQSAILKLVPDEDVMSYTRITDQALFYSGEDAFCHKILAIEEGPGMEKAAYSIRNIQSEGKITVAATGKSIKSDGLKTREYTVKGPVSVMVTTTATKLDEETASRFIVLTIDESRKMTKAIHERQRSAEDLNGILSRQNHKKRIAKHHNAQRLLKPAAVVNPFAKQLTFPAGSLKTRRDFKKYLGLIKAVAYLHQYQRKTHNTVINGEDLKYIEVVPDDIDKANALAAKVLCYSLNDLSAPSRQLLILIIRMVTEISEERRMPIPKIAFTRRMIREYTGWSNWQVRCYLPPLVDLEFIAYQSGSRANRYTYTVNRESGMGIIEKEFKLTPASQLNRETRAGAKG